MIGPILVDRHRPLVLASGSPRRRELLSAMAIPLEVRTFEVDEARLPDESVNAYLERIASMKLHAALDGLSREARSRVVLVADTVVVLDREALGKPVDHAHASRMLASLAGRSHEVRTRFAIGITASTDEAAREVFARTVTTTVHFRALSSDAIARYVATGEGVDKAGAYAIQGIGGFAVRGIEGSYSNVVGLPVAEVVEALESHQLIGPFPFVVRADA